MAVSDCGLGRLTAAALNKTSDGGWVGAPRDRELLFERRRARWTPRHLIGLHRGAEAFKVPQGQLRARRGEGWVVAEQVLVRGLANENAPPARSALQAAGQIHFAAKDSIILHF